MVLDLTLVFFHACMFFLMLYIYMSTLRPSRGAVDNLPTGLGVSPQSYDAL